MKLGLQLAEADPTDAVDFAIRAESLGYESVWVGELWRGDAFVSLSAIARETTTVRLGTAIVNVFSRSPAVLAMAAASINRGSDGRMVLGVGVSTPRAVEGIHGLDYDRPLRRTHETVELATRFLSTGNGNVDYRGEVFDVSDVPPLGEDVPVYNAALGPANRRLTGRLCDGWIPHNVPFSRLEEAYETVADAAREVGRAPGSIEVAPYVPAAVADDAADARNAVRGHVAYYVGSGEGYERAVATRYPDEAKRIAEAWRAGDRRRATEFVTDGMVSDLGIAGTPPQARAQLADLETGSIIDTTILVVPAIASDDVADRTIRELAPERR